MVRPRAQAIGIAGLYLATGSRSNRVNRALNAVTDAPAQRHAPAVTVEPQVGAIVLTSDDEIGKLPTSKQDRAPLDFDPIREPFRAIVAGVAAAGSAALTIEHGRMMPRLDAVTSRPDVTETS